jgi:hypothetical protein
LQSTAGTDILNGTGRLVNLAAGPGGVISATVVNMTNGDLEAQASDGQAPTGCTPGVPDGHANDLGSPFISNAFQAGNWSLIVSAPGFTPRAFGALPADDATAPNCGIVGLPGQPPVSPTPGRDGCLISLGTIQLQPLAAPAGRGVVSGTVFGTNGQPLDGAAVVLIDAAGNVHTRISGTDCNGVLLNVGGLVSLQTGFYCFSDSTPELYPRPTAIPAGALSTIFQNDGLGLPVGPARIVVINNTPANCVAGGGPGTACGFLPAFVSVNVVAAAVTGQDLTLANKFAPALAPPAGTAGAFGYVVNDAGQGVGGMIITATGPAGAAIPPPVTTSPQTGLWIMTGLTPATAYTFTLSGPGVSPANVRTGPVAVSTAAIIAAGATPLSVPRTTGGPLSFIDPNWVIVGQGPQSITLPIVGSAVIRGQVLGCQDPLAGSPVPGPGVIAPGLPPTTAAAGCIPLTGPGAFALLWSANTRTWAGATLFAGTGIAAGTVGGGTTPPFFPNAGWPAIVPLAGIAVQPFTSAPR